MSIVSSTFISNHDEIKLPVKIQVISILYPYF